MSIEESTQVFISPKKNRFLSLKIIFNMSICQKVVNTGRFSGGLRY